MESPLKGKVLVASPKLLDPNFAHSVVLIVQHDENGAMGLVINRALETTVGEAWSQVSSVPYPNDDPLFQGGPCEGPLIVLHKDETRGQMQVVDGIWLSSDADAVKALVDEGTEPMKFFVGYAGWSPLQLESELAEGSWGVAEIDSGFVLSTPMEVWEGLQKRTKVLIRPTTRPAIDPSAHSTGPARQLTLVRRNHRYKGEHVFDISFEVTTMSLSSLIASGTKVWLDSIDPELVRKNRAQGATGATSNPIILSDLIKTGRFDRELAAFASGGKSDEEISWLLTDALVKGAQEVFMPVWQETKGDNGYVSFELDPLLEDLANKMSHVEKVRAYIELGKKWAAGHKNRMIKVPATPAGIDALEGLCAAGVTLNVTLIFSERQYEAARTAIWRGAQARGTNGGGINGFKSVYSIFISRVDVYTEKHVPTLIPAAQGLVGIVNVKRLWRKNQAFWKDKNLRLTQEIIFASTGTKKASDPADKYVEALAGSDIQTNPPATNDAVEALGKTYTRQVDILPAKPILDDIDKKVDQAKLEEVLMQEGLAKFADPQKALITLVGEKRAKV